MSRNVRGLLAAVSLVAFAANSVTASDWKFFDDYTLSLWARENPPGVIEPAVPVFHNGASLGSFKLMEAFDQVMPETGCFPLTFVNIFANTYFRSTYQKLDGTTGSLGTSVVGSPSFVTSAGLQYIPSVSRADVFTGGADRVRTVVSGSFGNAAHVTSTRTFPNPVPGMTSNRLIVHFEVLADIMLDSAQLGSDAFRLMTVPTMFSDEGTYDANLIQYEGSDGVTHSFVLSNSTPRDAHLFASAVPIGTWFEVMKQPGSDWHPDSPSVRVDLVSQTGLTGQLGIQGFLAGTPNPNHDSLTIWVEWMNAPPPTLLAGTVIDVEILVTTSGDAHLTENEIADFVNVLIGLDTNPQHVARADMNCDGFANGADIQLFVNALLAP